MALEKDLGAVSAYAIACENGFEGTVEEWLESLIGPMGYQGWGVSAVRATTTGQLIFTVTDPKTGETKELDPVQADTVDALREIEAALDDAKKQVQDAANTASASAVKAVEGAQNAGVQAVGDAKTAAVEAITGAQTAGVQAVQGAQTQATEAVDTAKTQAVQAVEGAENTGVSAVEDAKSNALTKVGEAKTTAVDAVNAAGTQAASDAQTAITTAKNQAVSDVQAAGQSAVDAVEEAQTAGVQAVEDAKTGAVQSVQNAGTAEIEKINDILPVPTEADNGKILTVVDGKWAARDPGYPAETWADIQKIVRLGAAPRYFPVGYEFTTHDSTNDTDIIWRVVGYDTIKAADEALTHSMVLETKCVYSNSTGSYISMQFDAPETLYYAETGLEAGTYNFTLLAGYDETYGGGKTYSFTLTQPVPAGGIIMFSWGYNQQASETKISTYATQTDTSAIETVGVTEGANGTSLGTADGSTPNMNHTHRIRYGSNNYAQSAVKQWLNSNEGAGSVWKPQTKFDRPPTWANSRAGFAAGLPEDFISVVQQAIVPCRTNSVFEVNSLDGTAFTINQTYSLEDNFFLLSRPEIYGTWDSAEVKDGELLEYYSGLTDAERIKYDPSGSARYCWLRSPYPGYAYYVRHVNTSGALNSSGAYRALAPAPACIIA